MSQRGARLRNMHLMSAIFKDNGHKSEVFSSNNEGSCVAIVIIIQRLDFLCLIVKQTV